MHIFFKGVVIIWLVAAVATGYLGCVWIAATIEMATENGWLGFVTGVAAVSIMTGITLWVCKRIKL